MKLYHGTSSKFSKIDLEKSRDKRDFGKGFYTTTIYEQAASWADNVYTADMAIEQLKFFKVNDQISFHTEKALKCLLLEKSEALNG